MLLPLIPAAVASHILVAATGDDVPTIDIQKTCHIAAGATVSLTGGTTTASALNACLSAEQNAREFLVKGWSTFRAADRAHCIRLDAYLPSYVEWVTCLEMKQNVRKIQ
jgi:hypothetical protein